MINRPRTILQLLPKLDTGGAERVVIEIADGLRAAGHKCLIAAQPGPLLGAAARTGAQIVPLALDTKSPLAIRRNAGRIARVIAAHKVDLVHAHSRAPAWSGYWAARAQKIPFVTTYHGTYSEASGLKRRYNAIMARGDRVIAVSDYIAGLIRARYGTGDDRLRVILGGVDLIKFDPAAVVGDRVTRMGRDWRVSMGEPTIMLPGRLTSWKGQSLLIAALAKLSHREAIVVLAGDAQGRDAYVGQLLAQAAQLGVSDRLRLAGHHEDMPAAMMLADIVVNASTDPEAFGRVIVEAQAMGRIVIAADHGGARETIIPGETGFLFSPGDAQALAAAIDTALVMTPENRLEWAQRARAHVAAHYSLAAMQADTLAVYAELLG
ncbi:MAG: glycosyltransferase family 4 protein [Acidocella sp.]|nr:glycosyltransferase family 4 protein [Acidocella sp.]